MADLRAIGLGINGLAGGFSQGLQIGRQFKQLQRENKADDQNQEIEDIRTQGFADANKQREADVANSVRNISSTSPSAPQFQVGDESFADEKSAKAAADKKVGSISEYYEKTVVPRVRDAYLKQGNLEKAKAWDDWMDGEGVKRGMKSWDKAIVRASMGDADGFMKHAVDAYNAKGYFDDGITAKNAKPVKDDKGNITGYEMEFHEPSTGRSFKRQFNGKDDLYKEFANFLAPENVFKIGYDRVTAAEKARADVATEDAKHVRTLDTERVKHDFKMDEISTKAQLDAVGGKNSTLQKYNTVTDILRKHGVGEEEINGLIPNILGITQDRKSTSPQDAYMQTWRSFSEKDFKWGRRSEQERDTIVRETLKAADTFAKDKSGKTPATQSPAAAPKTLGASSHPGLSILDTKTGKIIPYGK